MPGVVENISSAALRPLDELLVIVSIVVDLSVKPLILLNRRSLNLST